jgi:hypothetical protein
MNAHDRVQLLFGPYKAPRLRPGERAFCMYRDCAVVITSWTSARISWPRCHAFGIRMATGLLLLFVPAVPLALLLGVGEAAAEALLVARVAGVALLAIGVASWSARKGEPSAAQLGLLVGILIYDGAAAAILANAGLGPGMVGIALWPAVIIHVTLAVWCLLCIAGTKSAGNGTG